MVEQPSPAPEGVPAGGAPTEAPVEGAPVEIPQEAPPALQSLLSSLSGQGQASASVRTMRRQ
jgi:hypothetical protein